VNPYAIIATMVAALALFVGGYALGRHQEAEHNVAEQVRDVAVANIAAEQAAQAISKIEVRNVTIQRQLETRVRDNPVYRDCVLDPVSLRQLNAARAESGADPGGLPASGPAP
jgi:uncharacterized protein HemX